MSRSRARGTRSRTPASTRGQRARRVRPRPRLIAELQLDPLLAELASHPPQRRRRVRRGCGWTPCAAPSRRGDRSTAIKNLVADRVAHPKRQLSNNQPEGHVNVIAPCCVGWCVQGNSRVHSRQARSRQVRCSRIRCYRIQCTRMEPRKPTSPRRRRRQRRALSGRLAPRAVTYLFPGQLCGRKRFAEGEDRLQIAFFLTA
jgi:hypothetical protein